MDNSYCPLGLQVRNGMAALKLATSLAAKEVLGPPEICTRLSGRRGQVRPIGNGRLRPLVVHSAIDTSWQKVGDMQSGQQHPVQRAHQLDGSEGAGCKVEQIRQLKLMTALKTPYAEDGSVDLDTWRELVRYQMDGGADAVVVAGTTGEGHLMDWEEHIALIQKTVAFVKEKRMEKYGGKAEKFRVVGCTGSNCTSEALNATKEGFRLGMDAALQINPYYGKTSLRGLTEHFGRLCDLGPSIIYNVPSRTNQDIPTSFMEELSRDSPNFVGVKECVGNDRVAHYTKLGLTVWSGNDDEFHEAKWKHEARGVISVLGNLVPGLVSKLLQTESSDVNDKVQPLVNWLFEEFNPIGVNTALAQLGVVKPVFRLPYYPRGIESRQKLLHIVEKIGREHFVGSEEVKVMKDEDFIIVHDSKRK